MNDSNRVDVREQSCALCGEAIGTESYFEDAAAGDGTIAFYHVRCV